MQIYERIFERLGLLHMNQAELSRRTGIATSTISDWRKKKINPQSDKLVAICKALDMSLVDLLCDEDEVKTYDYLADGKYIIENFRNNNMIHNQKGYRYNELLILCNKINERSKNQNLKRNIDIIRDIDGNSIVVINDIRFKGKRSVKWKEVKEYIREYIGDFYTIASTGDVIYIGSDLPKEYSGSKYTISLKGANAKAKANAAQSIPELIETAMGKHFRKNQEEKHKRDAKNGWYRYDSQFAIPIYDDTVQLKRYNVFHASLLVRHSSDGKMYLYDIIDIKKETSNSLGE